MTRTEMEETVRAKGPCRAAGAVMLACAVALVTLVGGCKSNSQFSEQELKQMKEGPPAEMPAEGRKMMQEMGNRRTPPPPPRPKGQPGPGEPF